MNGSAHPHSPDISTILSNPISSAAVDLGKIASPRMLWVNKEAAGLTGERVESQEMARYTSHLMQSCSYLAGGRGVTSEQGWADRYGGSGIGPHGGSGRSVLLNGYSVKGVGQTPLIGVDVPLAHSSGGAYLEEAIREAVLSQFLRKLLPHGASPILAIIDTGIDQSWTLHGGRIEKERRVLIVRPISLRPAHFERAYRYRPANFSEKRADIHRVTGNFQACCALLGKAGLRNALETCYVRWANQIAFALIHNIALGSSPSNFTLDGKILDFGAVSPLRQLANYLVSPGNSTLDDFSVLLESLGEVASSASGFDESAFDGFESATREKSIHSYESGILSEIFSITGLERFYRLIHDNTQARADILNGFNRYLNFASRLRLDLLPKRYPMTYQPLPGLDRIWAQDCPAELEQLARALSKYIPGAGEKARPPALKPWPMTRETLREEIASYVASAGDISDLDQAIRSFGERIG